MEEIEAAVEVLGADNLLMAHSTSAYPCGVEELNLRMIQTLKERFPGVPVGYSGHEVGLAPTWAAVSLGACFIERHITLDRAMWGSDQAASVEVIGMHQLVRNIRDIEKSLGDGIKCVYPSELSALKKLRRVKSPLKETTKNDRGYLLELTQQGKNSQKRKTEDLNVSTQKNGH